jgi:hypothetical protein
MNQVRPGDVIFSYFGGRIAAVSMAVTNAYDSSRPEDLGNETWGHAGKKIDVQYRDITGRLTIADLVPSLRPLLPELHSPLNRNGTENQGYLFELPASDDMQDGGVAFEMDLSAAALSSAQRASV